MTSNVKLGVNGKNLPAETLPDQVGHLLATGPQLKHRAFQFSGSSCTTSLRPHATQNLGGSVAARRERHRLWSPLSSGFPQPSQCGSPVTTSRRAP